MLKIISRLNLIYLFDYEECQYYKEVPYITNQGPAVENNLLNLLRNRVKKWLFATSDHGNEIQEDLNAIVGYDEKFNNAIVRHSLDSNDQAIFRNPNPINFTFHGMKKFDLVNPVIGKLVTQVKASKLTDYQLTKKLLEKSEVDKLQLWLDPLKYGVNTDEDDDENKGGGGRRGGDDGPGPGPPPPRTPQQEIDDIVRRLDILRGNTPDVSPDNTPAQNSRIIARQNQERFQNRQIKERERELSSIPKRIINKRKSSINFNFPDTPPQIPPQRSSRREFDEDEEDFPPPPHFLEPASPRETSFLFSDRSLSPLRNKLPNIAPLPSKPTIDNFARPITQITDEKNNTIAITPKRPVPKIEERNLFQQLQAIFPGVNETIKEESEIFKEKVEGLDEIINKVTLMMIKMNKKYLNLNCLQGRQIKNLMLLFKNLNFQAKIWSF